MTYWEHHIRWYITSNQVIPGICRNLCLNLYYEQNLGYYDEIGVHIYKTIFFDFLIRPLVIGYLLCYE